MLGDDIRRLIDSLSLAMVATTSVDGDPHLAVGTEPRVLDPEHLVFENWFCRTTLGNVARNPRVAVAVMRHDDGTGYQLLGRVVYGFDAAILDGFTPGMEAPGEPQMLTRLVVRIDTVLTFCRGIDTDQPVQS